MFIKIRIRGPIVPSNHIYQTDIGPISRFDLVDKYAQTAQGCLAITGSDYSPHSAGEFIMRAVIALLDNDGANRSPDHIVNKLENGLSRIGYFPVSRTNEARPESIIPALYITGLFPSHIDEWCKDDKTGILIGFNGLVNYLDAIAQCLRQTETYYCDEAVGYLVQVAKLLALPAPDLHKKVIEDLLWKALDTLGMRLDIVPWYKSRLAINN